MNPMPSEIVFPLLLAVVAVLLLGALLALWRLRRLKARGQPGPLIPVSDSDPDAEVAPSFDIPLPTFKIGGSIDSGGIVARWMDAHQACPVCRTKDSFLAGPWGGAAQNFRCSECGSTFNNLGPFGVTVLSVYYPRRLASG